MGEGKPKKDSTIFDEVLVKAYQKDFMKLVAKKNAALDYFASPIPDFSKEYVMTPVVYGVSKTEIPMEVKPEAVSTTWKLIDGKWIQFTDLPSKGSS